MERGRRAVDVVVVRKRRGGDEDALDVRGGADLVSFGLAEHGQGNGKPVTAAISAVAHAAGRRPGFPAAWGAGPFAGVHPGRRMPAARSTRPGRWPPLLPARPPGTRSDLLISVVESHVLRARPAVSAAADRSALIWASPSCRRDEGTQEHSQLYLSRCWSQAWRIPAVAGRCP